MTKPIRTNGYLVSELMGMQKSRKCSKIKALKALLESFPPLYCFTFIFRLPKKQLETAKNKGIFTNLRQRKTKGTIINPRTYEQHPKL